MHLSNRIFTENYTLRFDTKQDNLNLRIILIHIITFVLLLTNLICYSSDYFIEYITAEQGLSQNEVTTILQDSKGFMWFATRGGINRYDGYNFVHFKSGANQPGSLTSPSVEALFEDSQGNFWIGTKSGGLNFYDYKKEQFTQIKQFGNSEQEINDNRIITIDETTDGRILIGTWSSGLYILNHNSNSLEHFLNNLRIYTVFVEGQYAWIGTSYGFYKLDLETNNTKLVDLGKNVGVTEIIADYDNEHLWIGGWEGGLTSLNKSTLKWERFSLNKEDKAFVSSENHTYSLLLDQNGKLWIGTWGAGLFTFNRQNKTFDKVKIEPGYMGEFSSDYDIILDLFEDRNNNIWIGADGGGVVHLKTKKSFEGVSVLNNPDCGLKNFHITCFQQTNESILWVGTRGGGLYKSENNKFEYIPPQVESGESRIVKYMFKQSDSLLWVSTGTDIFEMDTSKDKLLLIPVTDKRIFNIKKITAIFDSGKDRLVGSQQNGLFILKNYHEGSNESININPRNDPVLKSDRITFIKKDVEGTIWVGTYNGLYQYNKANHSLEEITYTNQPLCNSIINCWEQSSNGIIWVGTPGGLNKLTKDSNGYLVEHFYEETGFPDNYINAILAEKNNQIWMSTNAGLIRMNTKDGKISSFDKTDGLQGMIFSESQGFKGSDGKFYFGGKDGFNYFDPVSVEINEEAPPVVFTSFKIFNKEITPRSKVNGRVIFDKTISGKPSIELSHKEKEFTIEFAALNYISSNRNKYKYKLEGYDSDWISLGNNRSVIFRNLQAGNYVFKVKSANNYNVWNDTATELAITITPPFWQTWYAITFYVLLVLGIVLIIRWNAVKQVQLSKNLELEKMQHAQDQRINEMKFQFFTNISHEFRTPLTLILAPIKEILSNESAKELPENTQYKLLVVQRNVKRLMSLINQLLDFRKAESGKMKLSARFSDIDALVKEVCFPFEELAKINEIDFNIYSRLKNKYVWIDREKLEIILNNLVSNAFKFTREKGKIRVSLFEEEDEILISVRDNGPGINPADLIHIFDRFYNVEKNGNDSSSGIGLALVKRLVEMHRGSVSVTSEPNKNTEFVVALPKGKAHLDAEEIIENSEDVKLTSFASEQSSLPAFLPSKFRKTSASGAAVLVVEDNQEMQDYIQSLLSPHYRVETAPNGAEGFEKALEEKPDLIISDVMMPKVDGFEFCKKIKEHQGLATVPFILLTAKSAGQFKLMGAKHGADIYISKPFDPYFLLQNVNNLLTRQEKLQKQYSKKIMLESSEIEITPVEEVFVKNVISIIEKNLLNPVFSSETLASELKISSSSLYRKLKSATGSSTAELIRTIRIKRAAQFLADKQRTITEIAYDIGFNDLKHFRTVFQKHFGCSPSEFRRKL